MSSIVILNITCQGNLNISIIIFSCKIELIPDFVSFKEGLYTGTQNDIMVILSLALFIVK